MQARGITSWTSCAATVLMLFGACGESGEGDTGGDDQGPPDAPVDMAAASATVSGSVRRTAQPSQTGDARGPIYLAIFDEDPVTNRDTAQVVARTVVMNADLSAPNATASYMIEDVPVRPSKYYFVGFLDDNANVDPLNAAQAGPDRGDLVSLDGLASPSITLANPGPTTFDVTLNTNLPF